MGISAGLSGDFGTSGGFLGDPESFFGISGELAAEECLELEDDEDSVADIVAL